MVIIIAAHVDKQINDDGLITVHGGEYDVSYNMLLGNMHTDLTHIYLSARYIATTANK
jgi:hypothetical protein